MISIFDLAALLLTLSALFGWLNHRFLRLPHTIGLLVMGLLASLALVGLDLALPGQHLYEDLTKILRQVDFTDVVMNGMLAFLLFAGAMSLDLRALRDRAWAVATLALFGTLISTAIVGGAFWLAADALGQPVPLAWALVFGALITVVIFVVVKGWAALHHLNFFTDDMTGIGPNDPLDRGGILHAMLGTLIELTIAVAITLPLGIGTAIFMTEVGGRFARVVRTVVEAMTALPSIVAGLFIYTTWIIALGMPRSGLAAGLGIAALLSHLGLGSAFASAMANVIVVAALAMAGIWLVRKLMSRTRREPALAYGANAAHGTRQSPSEAGSERFDASHGSGYGLRNSASVATAPGASNAAAPQFAGVAALALPAGFDAEAFVQHAKANFVRLQAASDAGNLADIRAVTTAAMFTDLKSEIDARHGAPARTDVVQLHAELLDLADHGAEYFASVRFSGLIRESADAAAEPFEEIWNLSKSAEPGEGWLLAGIQQSTTH